jgi:hypothetical protein
MLRRPLAKPRAQSRTWRQVRRQGTQNSDNQRLMCFCQRPPSVGLNRRSEMRFSPTTIPDLQRNSPPLAPKDRPRNKPRAPRIPRSSQTREALISSPQSTTP